LKITQHILEGVLYLHNHGIVHRDIKPDNILINSDQKIKILDFNVSAFHQDHHNFNYLSWNNYCMSQVTGTPSYNAPEMRETPFYTEIVDSWAVGLTLHSMLFGYLPENPTA